jgi:hypothetical protein
MATPNGYVTKNNFVVPLSTAKHGRKRDITKERATNA